ncbi:MAG: 3-deoxy-8-phosphooctulonate synthase [Candidatus Riflebacteria bacterium]|nr:3-deoxy-8-phosphooctulonate synthase [Candidatus Riflebacteria bacterium]
MKFSISSFSRNAPFFVIAGPCVIETSELTLDIAREVKKICNELALPVIFKASYDKANRTSGKSFRGPGPSEGLAILEKIASDTNLPILTDIHHPEEAEIASKVCSILQIPAFLCRQTDLLLAASRVCGTVNVKKGQFLSPWEARHISEKLRSNGNVEIILTERGTTFGYGNLIVDMRSFPIMKEYCDSVVFDCTHSLQLPGKGDGCTAGLREYIPHLARAAMATNCVNGIFIETHPNPLKSPSDANNILPLDELKGLLLQLKKIKNSLD